MYKFRQFLRKYRIVFKIIMVSAYILIFFMPSIKFSNDVTNLVNSVNPQSYIESYISPLKAAMAMWQMLKDRVIDKYFLIYFLHLAVWVVPMILFLIKRSVNSLAFAISYCLTLFINIIFILITAGNSNTLSLGFYILVSLFLLQFTYTLIIYKYRNVEQAIKAKKRLTRKIRWRKLKKQFIHIKNLYEFGRDETLKNRSLNPDGNVMLNITKSGDISPPSVDKKITVKNSKKYYEKRRKT